MGILCCFNDKPTPLRVRNTHLNYMKQGDPRLRGAGGLLCIQEMKTLAWSSHQIAKRTERKKCPWPTWVHVVWQGTPRLQIGQQTLQLVYAGPLTAAATFACQCGCSRDTHCSRSPWYLRLRSSTSAHSVTQDGGHRGEQTSTCDSQALGMGPSTGVPGYATPAWHLEKVTAPDHSADLVKCQRPFNQQDHVRRQPRVVLKHVENVQNKPRNQASSSSLFVESKNEQDHAGQA